MRLSDTSSARPVAARRAALIPALLIALTGLALFLRLWQLNSVPPGLWWDEATQGLDAAELLRGQFRLFYPSALGKEPLYIYLTAPFVAAWWGAPFAVRIAGALLSALTVPALFAAGRALFPDRPTAGAWAGLAAGALWATNFWAQSLSRIGFQVNALPLVMTVAVVAWLNWTRRPSRRRGVAFGIIAGLLFYTYLAARITPLLWLVLYMTLPRPVERRVRPTLPVALLALALVALPLAAHFALHPADFLGRISTFSVAQSASASAPPEPLRWSIEGSLKAFFGLLGDPIARHNLPDTPSFTVAGAGLFALGLITGALGVLLRRHRHAFTAIAWWLILCIPAILSRSSTPHYPRLLAALPAAILIAALPFGYLSWALGRRWGRRVTQVLALLLAGLVAFETARMTQAYFVHWAQQTDLYTAYQQDTWLIGERMRANPDAIGVVPLNEGYGAQFDYAFSDAAILQLPAGETDIAGWLDAHLGAAGGKRVISVAWGEGANQDADPRQLLQHYLAREGTLLGKESFRGFDLMTYQLGNAPQFAAAGQQAAINATFDPAVTLTGAAWGAAYPNADRSVASAAAGTPVWVTLTWRLDAAQPTLRAAVDLLDSAGHRLGSAEAELMDLRQRRQTWQAGDTVQTHHLITIPATLAPDEITLAARLYDATTQQPLTLPEGAADRLAAHFAQSNVTPPLTLPAPEISAPVNVAMAEGLTLLGADAWPASMRPGDTPTARLYWRVADAAARGQSLTLTLEGAAGKAAASAAFAIPDTVQPPAVIHTDVDLRVSAEVEPGAYALAVEDGAGGRAALGMMQVAGRARMWELPAVTQPLNATFGDAAQLEGIDAGQSVEVAPGQTITLTLVWRALAAPGVELSRFVHALGADGRPVAQRDGAPCAGWDGAPPDAACPSSSWLPGEFLADRISLTVPADLPPGRYPLATGWYDAALLSRLPALDANGKRLQDDLLRLPVELVVK